MTARSRTTDEARRGARTGVVQGRKRIETAKKRGEGVVQDRKGEGEGQGLVVVVVVVAGVGVRYRMNGRAGQGGRGRRGGMIQ